jgi:hypothetical protein
LKATKKMRSVFWLFFCILLAFEVFSRYSMDLYIY